MEITLSENIRKFRKERRLTQEQLAEVMGVTTGAGAAGISSAGGCASGTAEGAGVSSAAGAEAPQAQRDSRQASRRRPSAARRILRIFH